MLSCPERLQEPLGQEPQPLPQKRRRKKQRENAWKVSKESRSNEYAFRVCETEVLEPDTKRKGLMVDAGATSHIITHFTKIKRFNDSFQAKLHCVDLADGSKSSGVRKR